MNYEDEKEALLAALRAQDSRFATERSRQLALAKLRHEQKLLHDDDKISSALFLLSKAGQEEEALKKG